MRDQALLEVARTGAPVDVLWTRVGKDPALGERSLAYVGGGRFMLLIDRGDYFQCGYIIPKGAFEPFKRRGLETFQDDIIDLAPFVGEHVRKLDDWEKVRLLTVEINHLRRWYAPGLLCIGDAAHAMSPAGGVGINLAVQDAVAAANLLAPKLLSGGVGLEDLRRVQRRREWPARATQLAQALVHRTIARADPLNEDTPGQTSELVVKALRDLPLPRRLLARAVGLGLRPEHVGAEVR